MNHPPALLDRIFSALKAKHPEFNVGYNLMLSINPLSGILSMGDPQYREYLVAVWPPNSRTIDVVSDQRRMDHRLLGDAGYLVRAEAEGFQTLYTETLWGTLHDTPAPGAPLPRLFYALLATPTPETIEWVQIAELPSHANSDVNTVLDTTQAVRSTMQPL